MIKEVKATFACDKCGNEFTVRIDPAIVPGPGWSIFEVAEDAIRALLNYEDARIPKDEILLGGSVQDGRQYCQRCTDRKRG